MLASVSERRVCQICGEGRVEAAPSKARVPSNVRRWREHVSTVWRCGNCGCLHSLEEVNLEPFYEHYPYGQRRLDYFTRRVFSHYLDRLRRHSLHVRASVLDYGCSEGLFLSFLRGRGFRECEGYDAHSQRFSDPRVLARQYDLVVCQDVIEHVEDPRHLMRTLARCLRPGAMLCLGTPRADDIDLADFHRSIHSLHQPYHLHILSEQALGDLAAAARLQLEALYRRHSCDTPFPFVNWPFLKAYLAAHDDTLDAGFDPPAPAVFFRHPRLLGLGVFGYGLPIASEMIAILRKPVQQDS